jgi:DNA-binding PadR family transcriptional regulator
MEIPAVISVPAAGRREPQDRPGLYRATRFREGGLAGCRLLSVSNSVSDIASHEADPVEARMKHPIMKHQNLLKGLIRLHVLHHASKEEFFGQWMIHELARHGYRLSPGTLYPMLHALERQGYLKSRKERSGRTFRRLYRATALGREADRVAKIQVRELTSRRPDGVRRRANEE